MTKERKEYIVNLFRNYHENKKYLKFESTKRKADMSEEEKNYFKQLKNKVEVVDKIIFSLGLEEPMKGKFATEHFINGVTLKRLSFDLFLALHRL